jgi:uncharacterized protein (TIGR03435 family)
MKTSFLLRVPILLWAAAGAYGQTAGPAFEVATVKAAQPLTFELLRSGKAHTGVRIDKAYADFGGSSLTDLIAHAYLVKGIQVSGPDWMGTTRFDVLAKLPKGASAESVPEMLRALLVERFHLKLHTASKDLSVYALVIGKSGSTLRLKSVDYEPHYGPSDGNDLSPRTMEDYAMLLSGAVGRPVVDQTGLNGEYMLPVGAALRATLERRAPHRPAGSQADRDVPVDDIPADSDVTKALIGGLRLEPRKLPMKMIVVDHVDMTPTAN